MKQKLLNRIVLISTPSLSTCESTAVGGMSLPLEEDIVIGVSKNGTMKNIFLEASYTEPSFKFAEDLLSYFFKLPDDIAPINNDGRESGLSNETQAKNEDVNSYVNHYALISEGSTCRVYGSWSCFEYGRSYREETPERDGYLFEASVSMGLTTQ